MELNGKLLVAMPVLQDPNFDKTVILIVEHEQDSGTFGLVLNRPGNLGVQGFCEDLGVDWCGSSTAPLFIGGPVNPSVGWILHGPMDGDIESNEIIPGVHLSASEDVLRRVASQDKLNRRLFSGYSGWAPGQLAMEIRAGAWLTSDAPEGIVFSTEADEAWNKTMMYMGIDPFALVPGSLEVS
jgi:putative transcriptional regulator